MEQSAPRLTASACKNPCPTSTHECDQKEKSHSFQLTSGSDLVTSRSERKRSRRLCYLQPQVEHPYSNGHFEGKQDAWSLKENMSFTNER